MAKEELLGIGEVGEVIATSIRDFFGAEGNRRIVERLRAAGVQMAVTTAHRRPQTDRLKGLTIVVSGVFETFTRDGIKQTIEDNGGKVSESISGKTSFVVAGADMGPAKLAKAGELGVKVIDEAEFRRMIEA